MNSILIKLLIYTVFAHVLPQHFSGTSELIFKSIGLIALYDLFFYNVFYKIMIRLERNGANWLTTFACAILISFITVSVFVLNDIHDIESNWVEIIILALTVIVYAIEAYYDIQNDLRKQFQKYRKGN